MNYEQFKKEWADAMVYNPKEFDFEEDMNEYYIAYKESTLFKNAGASVKQWCEFFFADFDMDEHPYMLKEKALKTHHSNGLREMANKFRKNNGLAPLPMIERKNQKP